MALLLTTTTVAAAAAAASIVVWAHYADASNAPKVPIRRKQVRLQSWWETVEAARWIPEAQQISPRVPLQGAATWRI